MHATFSTVAIAPNAAVQVVDVEVERDTGPVTLLTYTTFQDVGLCVNPEQGEGQMQGGATQGIGWALSEDWSVNAAGALQNANLLDYRLPASMDVPPIGTQVVEIPSSDHPYGIRSVGQVPPPAAAFPRRHDLLSRPPGTLLFPASHTPLLASAYRLPGAHPPAEASRRHVRRGVEAREAGPACSGWTPRRPTGLGSRSLQGAPASARPPPGPRHQHARGLSRGKSLGHSAVDDNKKGL